MFLLSYVVIMFTLCMQSYCAAVEYEESSTRSMYVHENKQSGDSAAEILYHSLALVHKLQALRVRCVSSCERMCSMLASVDVSDITCFDESKRFDGLVYFGSLVQAMESLDGRIAEMQMMLITALRTFSNKVLEDDEAHVRSGLMLADEHSRVKESIDTYRMRLNEVIETAHEYGEVLCTDYALLMQQCYELWSQHVNRLRLSRNEAIELHDMIVQKCREQISKWLLYAQECAAACIKDMCNDYDIARSYVCNVDEDAICGICTQIDEFAKRTSELYSDVRQKVSAWMDSAGRGAQAAIGAEHSDVVRKAQAYIKELQEKFNAMLAQRIDDQSDVRYAYEDNVAQLKDMIHVKAQGWFDFYSYKKVVTTECIKNKLLSCVASLKKTGQECVDEINRNATLIISAPQENIEEFLLSGDRILAKIEKIVGLFQNSLNICISNFISESRATSASLENSIALIQPIIAYDGTEQINLLASDSNMLYAQQLLHEQATYKADTQAIDGFFDTIQKMLSSCSSELEKAAARYDSAFRISVAQDVNQAEIVLAQADTQLYTLLQAQMGNSSRQSAEVLFANLDCLVARQQGELCEKFSTAQKEMIVAVDEMIIALEAIKGLISTTIASGLENLASMVTNGTQAEIDLASVALERVIHLYKMLFVSVIKVFLILGLPV